MIQRNQAVISGWKVTLAASMASLAVTSAAFGQAKPAAPAVGGKAADSSMEDKLMGKLAMSEMDSLLTYYFKKNSIPEEKQAVIRSVSAWIELSKPNLTAGRRKQLISDGVKGIASFLESTKDTELLMRRANELIEYGVKGQINQIEYFGETPARQAELNASADAVVKILDKVAIECEQQQAKLFGANVRPSDAQMKQWQTLDERGQTAKWTKAFSTYGWVLSMDAADAKRKEQADAAILFLNDFDKPEYGREVSVKTQVGKLQMVKGDYDAALAKFAEAMKVPAIEKDQAGQYDCLFFTTLANLLGKREQPAVDSLAALQKWVGEKLSPEGQKAVSAGIGLLDYRINEMRASISKDPAAQRKFSEAGEAALNKLMKDNPKLEPVIKKMLLEKLPADADVSKLDTVLLRALLAKGVDEVIRAKEGLADEKAKPVLERAIKAADEIGKRAGQAPEDAIDEAAYLRMIFYSKLGKHTETVEGALDYIKNFPKNKERQSNSLAFALQSVEVLRKSPESASPKVGDLINRTWKAAVTGGMKEYSFVYGKRLFDQSKTPAEFQEAATILHQVADNHPAAVHARFYELNALQEVIDDKKLDPAVKKTTIASIQKLAADVNQRIDAALTTAKEEQKPRLKFYQVSAILLAADLMAKESKDFASVLTLLSGFEAKAKGMPKEDKLVGTALRLRVTANMALGKTQEAVKEVQQIVAAGGTGAANILYNLIQQLDDGYAKAKAAGDVEGMQENSRTQVALIGPLIKQTTDPAAKAAYEAWEATLLLRTARIETNADKKKELLTKAQGVFARQLKAAKEDTPEFDSLRYKLALISYELKDYKKVQEEMGQLIALNKLGPPDKREADPATGEDKFTENPVYWEGLLRFMQSNLALSKIDVGNVPLQEALKNHRETLKGLYINRGSNVGGDRLKDEYAKLKADLLPGWDETKIDTTVKPKTPAPAATKPAAAAAGK